MLNCIYIDNELHNQQILKDYCSRVSFINLTSVFTNPLSAIPFLKANKLDLVFINFDMNELSLTDIIQYIPSFTSIILLTTELSYKIKSYNLTVSYIIFQPFSFERFFQSVQMALIKTS